MITEPPKLPARLTYLRFAEAVNRLDLTENGSSKRLTQGAAKRKTAGAIDAVKERVEEVFSRDEHADPND